jgi:hypothetical protein
MQNKQVLKTNKFYTYMPKLFLLIYYIKHDKLLVFCKLFLSKRSVMWRKSGLFWPIVTTYPTNLALYWTRCMQIHYSLYKKISWAVSITYNEVCLYSKLILHWLRKTFLKGLSKIGHNAGKETSNTCSGCYL